MSAPFERRRDMKAARRAGVVLLLHYLSYTLRHAPRGVGAGHSRPDPSRRCLKTQILNQRPGWRTLPRANQWTASRRRKKRRAADAHLAMVSKSGPGNGDRASWRAAGAARRCRPNTRTSFRAPVRRGRARRRNRKALRLIQVSLLREVSDPGEYQRRFCRSVERGGRGSATFKLRPCATRTTLVSIQARVHRASPVRYRLRSYTVSLCTDRNPPLSPELPKSNASTRPNGRGAFPYTENRRLIMRIQEPQKIRSSPQLVAKRRKRLVVPDTRKIGGSTRRSTLKKHNLRPGVARTRPSSTGRVRSDAFRGQPTVHGSSGAAE